MRVLSTLDVPWPSPQYPVHVRAGSLVSIDMANAAMVATYGGAANLQPVTADLGSPDSLDKSWLAN
jgi:hypothetical protein